MRALIKTVLRAILVPSMRFLAPVFEDARRIKAYLLLCSRVTNAVHASVVALGVPEVRGTGRILFGHNILLYPDLYLETQNSAKIQLGDDVVISRGVHIVAHSGVQIGPGTMIGEYTSIRDANHEREASGLLRDGAHSTAPISIGSRVWIGRGVTVLPGISIGDDATVGANAVVTRDVPDGVTVVGVPAVPIGSRRATESKQYRAR